MLIAAKIVMLLCNFIQCSDKVPLDRESDNWPFVNLDVVLNSAFSRINTNPAILNFAMFLLPNSSVSHLRSFGTTQSSMLIYSPLE
jgi:hypothetical protein